MTPRPALVASDLDGTLVRSDGTVSVRSQAVLARVEAAGVPFVIVTGRPPRWLADMADQTGHHGLALCANGALVYDLHTEAVVSVRTLSPPDLAEVVQRLRASVPGVAFAVESADVPFGHEPDYLARYPVAGGAVGPVEELLDGQVVKLLARHEGMTSDALLAAAAPLLAGLATPTHSTGDSALLEISALGVSKASALQAFADERGLAPADAVAFGDMPNDLPMLAWAGLGVAVAGAHPEVLAAADEVTASNDEDGVALVLERWF